MKYSPYMDKLYKFRILTRIHANQTFKNVFKNNLTEHFYSIVRNIVNPKHLHPDNVILSISGMTGCQPKGSKVLMYDGNFKNIEEIQVDDCVMSYDAKLNSMPARVIRLFKWRSDENYEIRQLNRHRKRLYLCSYNHIIPYMCRRTFRTTPDDSTRRNVKWQLTELPAQSFANIDKTMLKHNMQGLLAPAIQRFWQPYNCMIEPYALGVFLSDGNYYRGFRNKNGNKTFSLVITKNNERVIQEIARYYPYMSNYLEQKNHATAYHWSVRSLFAQHLDKYGLNGKTAGDKFIPTEALHSDIQYRKRLLAGLIDGDGSFENGAYSFTSKSYRLIMDIEYLVSSLGGRVNQVKTRQCTIKSYGFKGRYWMISFFIHEDSEIPVLTEHKKKSSKSYYLRSNSLSIQAVKTKKSHDVYGFTLHSPTGYYVTDNWMLTHNSGKSILALSLGIKLFPEFTQKNMFFFDQQILDHANEFKHNSLIVRDENPAKGLFGVGSHRIEQQIALLSEVARKQGLNLALIEPAFAKNDIVKYYLETIDMDVKERITRCGLIDAYSLDYLGAVYIRVVPEDNPEWIAYNKRKDEFINSIKSGNMAEGKADMMAEAKRLAKEIDLEKFKKKNERLAFIQYKYSNLTTTEQKILSTFLEIELREGSNIIPPSKDGGF